MISFDQLEIRMLETLTHLLPLVNQINAPILVAYMQTIGKTLISKD